MKESTKHKAWACLILMLGVPATLFSMGLGVLGIIEGPKLLGVLILLLGAGVGTAIINLGHNLIQEARRTAKNEVTR